MGALLRRAAAGVRNLAGRVRRTVLNRTGHPDGQPQRASSPSRASSSGSAVG